MTDPIKDALRAAAVAAVGADNARGYPTFEAWGEAIAAAAVAAFLKALPDDVIIRRDRIGYTRNDFAGMVDKAARDE